MQSGQALLAAISHRLEQGAEGAVWLDVNLVVQSRHGRLAEFVVMRCPVTDSLPALIGLESEILAHRTSGGVLELPAIGLMAPNTPEGKIDVSVSWSNAQNAFLLSMIRTMPRPDVEQELSRQVRARLIAEAELAAKANALSQANRDLEDFAGIIAHDLAAPLRAMRHLAESASLGIAAGQTDEARAGLEKLQIQSRRMTHMLSSLLDYASAGRKHEVTGNIDTRALVETVATSLPRPQQIRIEIAGEWPLLQTAAVPLDLALRNLIGNAIKHHDRMAGLVRVTCREAGDALEISIADDGPGIPAHLQDAVFLPFRTLEPAQGVPEQSGTGMGLALVRRTIEAAGGSVTVESDPGSARGATFHLRWPKAIPI